MDNPSAPHTNQADSTDSPPNAVELRRASYLSDSAQRYSETFSSLVDAGNRVELLAGGWLFPKATFKEEPAIFFLVWVAHDFALWLASHGGEGPLTVTLGWEPPRVLIQLQDRGTATPNRSGSMMGHLMLTRMLRQYAVDWSCEVDAEGNRLTRIFGDVTARHGRPEGVAQ